MKGLLVTLSWLLPTVAVSGGLYWIVVALPDYWEARRLVMLNVGPICQRQLTKARVICWIVGMGSVLAAVSYGFLCIMVGPFEA